MKQLKDLRLLQGITETETAETGITATGITVPEIMAAGTIISGIMKTEGIM